MRDAHLADNIWKEVRGHIDPYSRREVAQTILDMFLEQHDTVLHESYQLQKDATAEDYEIDDDWAPDYSIYDEWEDE